MKLFLLGGFLGSGKTTAIQQACAELLGRRVRTGVITNDQGMQLVDSAFIKGHKIPNREVVKGCFCCNYSQLEEGIRSLREEASPEILFAESVGTCTDIVATVIKPLLKFHPDLEIVYSVFADALLLKKKAEGASLFFDDDVHYIYEKQLEEADILIVNKTDLLSEEEKREIEHWLKISCPDKKLLFQNSLKAEDIKKWLETLDHYDPVKERKTLQIDYDKYGAGETKLAWLDEELYLSSEDDQIVALTVGLINRIYEKIQQKGFPIGHLKFLMTSGQWQRKISFTSLYEPPLKPTRSLMHINSLNLIVNARVQTAPDTLKHLFSEAVKEVSQHNNCKIESKRSSAFRPGLPKPEYRIAY